MLLKRVLVVFKGIWRKTGGQTFWVGEVTQGSHPLLQGRALLSLLKQPILACPWSRCASNRSSPEGGSAADIQHALACRYAATRAWCVLSTIFTWCVLSYAHQPHVCYHCGQEPQQKMQSMFGGKELNHEDLRRSWVSVCYYRSHRYQKELWR